MSYFTFVIVFFIALAVNIYLHSLVNLLLVITLVIVFYYFSENACGGILIIFTIATFVFDIIFVKQKYEIYVVILEYISIVCLCLILEMYKIKYISIKKCFSEKYNVISKEIILINYEISENKKMIVDLTQRIRDFKEIGKIFQSLQASSVERKIIEKSEDIAYKFIGKGSWKLKKYEDNDVLASYIKSTSLPLMIRDATNDNRFLFLRQQNSSNKMSFIATSIKFNEVFWGILQGSSNIKNFFSEHDLRQLSLLSGIVSTVLDNFYLCKQLQTLAITDGLTGLYNQTYFKEILREEIDRSRSNRFPLSLGILDVDFFKNINDRYGHQSGDSILRQVSSILRSRFRRTDFVARYGGEEFAFVMLRTNSREAVKILEHIRLKIEKQSFFLPIESLYPIQIKITVSIGFASLTGNSHISEEKFIKNVDSALYKAKQLGRNRVECFSYE
ncbi:MAG: sensor domain-containing diguanylate cyclase [Endomicrobium sp.]|nr:sensor domain-containing diguanylate cyclase [Endomicrobium sp.]